jgi:tRNA(Ile)-lysidine synthase
MQALIRQVANFIKDHSLLNEGDRVLVAISGGPDSVFLAHALLELGYFIGLAHCNYKLREGDSELDESLVLHYAGKWKVPVFIQEFDTKKAAQAEKLPIQLFARKVRYAFFEYLIQEKGFDSCATAHHADDQVETLLLNLIRGNHPDVLKGIPVIREKYIRPLLGIRKQEILDYLVDHDLDYRIDASNTGTDYLRNKLRNELIPSVLELNPRFGDNLLQRDELHQERNAFLSRYLDRRFQEIAQKLPVLDLSHIPEEEKRVVAASWLDKWEIHGHAFWEALDLINSQPGKWVACQWGMVYRSRTGIEIAAGNGGGEETVTIHKQSELPVEGIIKLGANEIRLCYPAGRDGLWEEGVHLLDADALEFPICFRRWKSGDRMKPLGMRTTKKLSDIFADEKYKRSSKKGAVVLESGGKVVLLSGFRVAETVKVTPDSRNLLQIIFT